jgi:hypothetical protein
MSMKNLIKIQEGFGKDSGRIQKFPEAFSELSWNCPGTDTKKAGTILLTFREENGFS